MHTADGRAAVHTEDPANFLPELDPFVCQEIETQFKLHKESEFMGSIRKCKAEPDRRLPAGSLGHYFSVACASLCVYVRAHALTSFSGILTPHSDDGRGPLSQEVSKSFIPGLPLIGPS